MNPRQHARELREKLLGNSGHGDLPDQRVLVKRLRGPCISGLYSFKRLREELSLTSDRQPRLGKVTCATGRRVLQVLAWDAISQTSRRFSAILPALRGTMTRSRIHSAHKQ